MRNDGYCGGKMLEARSELLKTLRQVRALLALPGNDFTWSSWEDGPTAIAELDRHIAAIESGQLPPRLALAVFFAPTGPIQEVSLSSGWAYEFLAISARFDVALKHVYAEPDGASNGS